MEWAKPVLPLGSKVVGSRPDHETVLSFAEVYKISKLLQTQGLFRTSVF